MHPRPHRDASASGSEAELSGTAALIELARVFAARETQRTIVLVSTSGGSGGDAGALDFVANENAPLDAAIVLGDVAGVSEHKSFVMPYSDGFGSATELLQRTIAGAIMQNLGGNPGAPSAIGQLAHLAFGFATGEQGALNASGLPAVLVQVSGEATPPANEAVSQERLEGFGRAVLSAVDALDAAPDVEATPQTGVVLGRQVLGEWALRLLLATLLIPPLLLLLMGMRACAAAGATAAIGRCSGVWPGRCPARCRSSWRPSSPRRSAGWGRSRPRPRCPYRRARCRSMAPPCGRCWRWCWCWASAGWHGHGPCGGWAQAAAGRRRRGRLGDADGAARRRGGGLGAQPVRGAAGASGPAPVAAALVSPRTRPARAAALALVALALVPLALLIAFYARELGVGPGGISWEAVLLLAGGQVGVAAMVLWSLAFGCVAAATLLALTPTDADDRIDDGTPLRIRGGWAGSKSYYAGPGSLGGTESALRR